MTSFGYARPAATAGRLIARFGQSGILRRTINSGTSYDPSGTSEDHACTFAVEVYRAFEVDGTRIRATDKKVLLSKGSLAIEPATSDKLLIGGVEHSIVNVEPLAPGGSAVMFTLQCRR